MTDREKVIKGLEQFIADFKPFCGNKADWQRVYDALALLKAQEPIRPRVGILHNEDGSKVYFLHCPLDGTTLDESDKYCRKCGRMVKLDG